MFKNKKILIIVVDDSGVLYDPEGINKENMKILAKNNHSVSFYRGPFSH